MAGLLIPIIDVTGIIAIDLITLIIALVFLLIVLIPEPKRKHIEGITGAFFKELIYGFRYIIERRSLLYLQLVFFLGNFFFTIAYTLLTPMILRDWRVSWGGDFNGMGRTQEKNTWCFDWLDIEWLPGIGVDGYWALSTVLVNRTFFYDVCITVDKWV